MILAAVLAAARPGAGAPPSPDRDRGVNVVLIVVDALRADHLGAYGYSRATSPHIDAWARRGTLFRSAVAQANWTLPSLASIMTSLYPSVHGALRAFQDGEWIPKLKKRTEMPGAGEKLDESRTTLAAILGRQGYLCAGIVAGGYPKAVFGFGQGFTQYFEYSHSNKGNLERLNERILPWLKDNAQRKFFLYIHINDVHSPYGKHEGYRRKWDPDYRGPADGSADFLSAAADGKVLLTEADRRHSMALYDGNIAYADHHLQDIFAALESADLKGRTLVILTADHGESFLEHARHMVHGTSPYEEELRVPLIMSGPGLKPAVIDEPVQLVDLVPTVLESVGIPIPAGLEGVSLLPLIAGRGDRNKAVYSEPSGNGGRMLGAPVGSVIARTQRWKLIHALDGKGDELYDLAADPQERRNRLDEYPEVAVDLRSRLSAWQAGMARTLRGLPPLEGESSAPDKPADETVGESLRAGGYLR